MNAGKLRQRVKIQELARVEDGYGGYAEAWRDVAAAWAAVEPLRGSERYAAQQVQAELTHRVVMRYRPGVRPQMRLVYGDRVLEIAAVIDMEERHKWLELLCTEVISASA
jgi:SPP1 family predicted phage head-tail adaptor